MLLLPISLRKIIKVITMTTNNKSSKLNWKIIAVFIVILTICIYSFEQLRKSSIGQSNEILKLQERLNMEAQLNRKLKSDLALNQRQLRELLPYKAIIRSASLRDSIYTLLPFKFGESAFIMPDSMPVIINAVNIMGNSTEYSIKYIVRTKKGEYLQTSLTDLRK